MESSATTKPVNSAQSAIIFSRELIRQLEGSELRLPTTYIGVRQVRPAGGKVKETGGKRKRDAPEPFDKVEDVEDWSPNASSCEVNTDTNAAEANIVKNSGVVTPHPNTFKVTNPDGTERRMTAQEKKKLKQKVKQAQHLARKEQKQIEVKERIRVEKEKKMERKRLKLLAKQKKLQNANNDAQADQPIPNKGSSSVNQGGQAETESNVLLQEDQDEETERKYKGNPPVVLTPAATRVAFALGALPAHNIQDDMMITTVLDDELANQWASQINESMIPAEQQRAKEDIRQMPYKLVPEVWNRLRPKRNSDISVAEKVSCPGGLNSQSYAIATIRNPSPSFDESTYLILRHLHQHFNLHLACGARFGCDYLVYDGRREEKHSFAGLRIYHVTDGDNSTMLPAPSAYDLHGFVRAMNTARKLALVATVRRSRDDPCVARIAIVDVALEAVLTAPTHIKKGNTDKRRFVGDTNELIKRKT
ncbi:hypothetical protein ACHAXN_012753 [Cyclotella atomus]|jgi:tRNA splicing endonuclease